MGQFVLLFILVSLSFLSCQILPITIENGQNDMASQMTLMDHSIAALQSQMTATNNELTSVKSQQRSTESELSAVKSALQSQLLAADSELKAVKSRLQNTESELATVKTILGSAQAEIGVLKQELAKSPDPKEYTQMKADLNLLRVQYTTLTSHLNATSNTNNVKVLNASFNSLHNYIGNMNASAQKNAGDIAALKTELSSLNTLHQSLTTTTSDIHISAQRNAGEIAALTSEITKVKSLDTDVNTTKTLCQKSVSDTKSLRSNISEISGKVSTIQHSLLNITGSSYRQRNSFEVRQMKDNEPYGYSDILNFDDVTLNTGNCYNPQTGVYLAPVDGTYLFWANVMGKNSTVVGIIFLKGGREIARGYTGHNVHDGTATMNTVVQLKKGDEIKIMNIQRGELIRLFGYGYSSYGGTLL